MTATSIAVTSGDPAGIGPDIIAKLTTYELGVALIYIGDPDLLKQRANNLGIKLRIKEPDRVDLNKSRVGEVYCLPEKLVRPVVPGILDIANSTYVINCLNSAFNGAMSRYFDAVVTAPVHKANLIDAGLNFIGHTEYFARMADVDDVVMLLVHNKRRVALVTTHIPLSKVSEAITKKRIEATVSILNAELRRRFSITYPKIAVLGLNPHAGEGGKIGTEEQDIIIPAIRQLRQNKINVIGPKSADTAFVEPLNKFDAVVAMYHDQGLPVIKSHGFGSTVNVTLGLPFVRTSVDHGTALTLAGTSLAEEGSLVHAVKLADTLVKGKKKLPKSTSWALID